MILAASLILGTLFGWRHGRSPSAYARFAISWLVALVVQTIVLWTSSDSVRNRATGELDLRYPMLCVTIFALGLTVVTIAGTVRQHRQAA